MSGKTKLGLYALGAAALLGALGDSLLRETPWGINAVIWLAALCGMGGLLARSSQDRFAGAGRWLFIPALLFAAGLAWRDSPVLKALDGAAAISLLSLAVLCSRAGWIPAAGVVEFLGGMVRTASCAVWGAGPLAMRDVEWRTIPRGPWARHGIAAARGLLIALPLLLLFGALLVSADAVFQRMINDCLRIDSDALATHLMIAGVCAWLAGGFLRGALLEPQAAEAAPSSLKPITLSIVEVATVMGLLDLLFLAFVCIQVRYLFGGSALVRATTGLTYAQYARRGFFELVAVAALVLPVLLHAHALLRGESAVAQRIYRALAAVMLASVFVVMASAVYRMRLYQGEYGQTELRFYTTAFMGWLAVLFAWFAATVLTGRRRRFALGAMASGYAAVVVLNMANPDGRIAAANAAGAAAGKHFDTAYALSLSADAVPALAAAVPNLSPSDGFALVVGMQKRWGSGWTDWRRWNWGIAQARAAAWRAAPLAARDATPVPRHI